MAFNKFRRFPVKWIGQKRKNERCRRLFGGSQRERRVVQVKGCSPERHLGSNCTGGLHGRCRCTIIRSLAQAPAASDEGSRPVPAAQFPAAPAAGITCSVDSALPFRIFTVFFFSSSSAAFSLWNSWAARLGSFFIEFRLFKRIHFDSVVFARCNNNNRADRVTWSGAILWCEHLWFWLSTKVEHSPAEWFCKNCGFTAAGRIGRPSPSESHHLIVSLGFSLKIMCKKLCIRICKLCIPKKNYYIFGMILWTHVDCYLKRKLYWVKEWTWLRVKGTECNNEFSLLKGKIHLLFGCFYFFQKWLYFVVYASICASLRLTPRRITLAGIDAGRIFDIWALNGEGLRVVRRKFGRFHLLAGSTFAIGSSLAAETNKKAKVSSLQPRR